MNADRRPRRADFGMIIALLIDNAVSDSWQERKAADALAALKVGMATKASRCCSTR
jgi:hypothetical protein